MRGLMRRFVWVLGVLVIAAALYQVIAGIDSATRGFSLLSQILWGLLPAVFATTAVIIVGRQPRNAVGWLLSVPAIGNLMDILTGPMVSLTSPPQSPGLLAIAALSYNNFSWILLIIPIFHLLLVFPNGRLLSGRWRVFGWLEAAAIATMITLATFTVQIGPVDGPWTVGNPIGFIPVSVSDGGAFIVVWSAMLVVITLAGVTSMVMRFRRAGPGERHQIKWLIFAVAIFGVVYSYGAVFTDFSKGGWFDSVLALSIIGIPVAIAIGVLRYRLFDIDRVISRTVGYALVVGVLGLVYAAGAVWLPSRLTGDSPVFVAGATLAVAALFNPVRRRVLHWVDRRFYRSRFDAERVVEEFSGRLRRLTDVDRLTEDWLEVVTETMQPSAIGVWVKTP